MDVGPLPHERCDGREVPARGPRRMPGPVPRPTPGRTPDAAPAAGAFTAADGSVRRVCDVVGAAILLVLSLPALIVGMAAVWRAAGRPLFFAHRRVGRGGRSFACWKLRTMHVGAEDVLGRDDELRLRHREHGFKLPEAEDPRVIDRLEWMRGTHLDELPQLVNVLRGDMSLIGPRPVVREELACYGSEWTTLVSRRPGIIGAWTAEGGARPPYPERARLELDYVRRAGLRADLSILVRTALSPFRRRAGGG